MSIKIKSVVLRDCCQPQDIKPYNGMQYKNINEFVFPTIGYFCCHCGQLFQKEDEIPEYELIPWMRYSKHES